MAYLSSALAGTRILSLALNLPGPAALLRLRHMGAHCTKLEAPAPAGSTTSDPMGHYDAQAYAQMHAGVEIVHCNLKTDEGQAALDALLQTSDVLLTSFRPAALQKLRLDWASLSARHPHLNLVQIVGAAGERGNEAGHDLTYQAEAGLVPGLEVPPSLLADMAGALVASEAVLQCLLARQHTGQGQFLEVALFDAARWLAMPRDWGMTLPSGVTGGAHAGYRIYPCQDGRVAFAALEPHFALRLWQQVSGDAQTTVPADMLSGATQQAIAAFCAGKTRAELDALAARHDVPLYTMA